MNSKKPLTVNHQEFCDLIEMNGIQATAKAARLTRRPVHHFMRSEGNVKMLTIQKIMNVLDIDIYQMTTED